ncbi:MAG TPA: hypothetical protein VGC65_00165 [Bacteroidia bacterium]|jgi:hypothetical protein
MITIQIKAVGSAIYSEVPKKDFLGALENCDSVNDIIAINGQSYTLSSVNLCCSETATTATTTTSEVADVYTATGVATPVVLSSGLRVALAVNISNTGPATVNYDGTGAKSILNAGEELAEGELAAGQTYPLIYNGEAFDIVTANEPLVFEGLVSHQGAAVAPTSIVLTNALRVLPVWSYVGVGVFDLTSAAFTEGKTHVLMDNIPNGNLKNRNSYARQSATSFRFRTDYDAVAANGVYEETAITIKVYP